MDLISALKSGRRIKHKKWIAFYEPDILNASTSFLIEEMISDEWEIEAPKVEITLEQLNAAFDNYTKKLDMSFDSNIIMKEFIAKELGLIEGEKKC